MSGFSSTVYPMSCAIWMIESRVMPGRIPVPRSGVAIAPAELVRLTRGRVEDVVLESR